MLSEPRKDMLAARVTLMSDSFSRSREVEAVGVRINMFANNTPHISLQASVHL